MDYSELLSKIDSAHRELAQHRPFEGDVLPLIRAYYRVACTYTSNVIEGFTYTETETKVLLEDGLTAGGKSLKDMYAVLGHAKAYDCMYDIIKNDTLTEKDVLLFHTMLQGSLENDAVAGAYRTGSVLVTGTDYVFLAPDQVSEAMRRFFVQLDEYKKSMHPVELATYVHKEIATIHPFGDGNGRVARLAMNTILLQRGYLPAVIAPVLRSEYMDALRQTNFAKDASFKMFIARAVYEELMAMNRQLTGARVL